MLGPYLNAAMARATIDKQANDTFKGEIPGFDGLEATGPTLEACRANLEKALEEWVLLYLQLDFPLPDVGIPTT